MRFSWQSGISVGTLSAGEMVGIEEMGINKWVLWFPWSSCSAPCVRKGIHKEKLGTGYTKCRKKKVRSGVRRRSLNKREKSPLLLGQLNAKSRFCLCHTAPVGCSEFKLTLHRWSVIVFVTLWTCSKLIHCLIWEMFLNKDESCALNMQSAVEHLIKWVSNWGSKMSVNF